MKNKNIVDSPYFEFLRYCLREDEAEPEGIANINWDRLYDFGKKQAILGVLYHGLQRLSASDYRPNRQQVLKWYICNNILVFFNMYSKKREFDT